MFPDAGQMFGDNDDNNSFNLIDEHTDDESEDKGADTLVKKKKEKDKSISDLV